MNKEQFTPGPWRVETFTKGGNPTQFFNVYGGHDTVVCNMPNQRESSVNANLIAAAPDMYEALKGTIEILRILKYEGHYLDEAKAALNKANPQI